MRYKENPYFESEPTGLAETQARYRLIAEEFPGWEAFRGVDALWHARIKGAEPPIMVHGESSYALRENIIGWLRANDPRWTAANWTAANLTEEGQEQDDNWILP